MSGAPQSLAILFADLGGSTRLYDRLGDTMAQRIVAESIEQIITAASTADGEVIKTIGDEVMFAFRDADAALDGATAIIAALDPHENCGLGVHVGFHHGSVVLEKDDVFGDTVNVAARMVGLAKDGEILTTGQVVERLSPDRRALTRQIDHRTVRGKEEKVDVYSVVAPSDGKLTALNFAIFGNPEEGPGAMITLRLDGREITLDADRPRATIGRQEGVDLLLGDVGVSRQHASVELRHGKFYLCDQSTNGTVLVTNDDGPTYLRREEAILLGSGRFGLSRYPEPEPATPIEFVVTTA